MAREILVGADAIKVTVVTFRVVPANKGKIVVASMVSKVV